MAHVLYLSLIFLCIIQYISGESCYQKCTEETNSVLSEEKEAMSTDIVIDACSFGCRMARIDDMLYPEPANLTWCRKYCVNGYNTLEEIRSCIIGCNITMETRISSTNDDSLKNTDSSVLDYFTPVISYSVTLISFNDNQNIAETDTRTDIAETDTRTDISTGDQEQQTTYTVFEYFKLYIYGSSINGSAYVIIQTETDSATPISHAFVITHGCVWAALQFSCFVLILVSFVLCFCMFFTNEEHKESKYNYKYKPVSNPISVPVDIYTFPVKMGGEKKPIVMLTQV